jgi:hypothetical protein
MSKLPLAQARSSRMEQTLDATMTSALSPMHTGKKYIKPVKGSQLHKSNSYRGKNSDSDYSDENEDKV